MTIYLKSGGRLRELLEPDFNYYTRKLEVESGKTVAEILKSININPTNYVAFLFVNKKVQQLDYIPQDGETITLQPPVAGG